MSKHKHTEKMEEEIPLEETQTPNEEETVQEPAQPNYYDQYVRLSADFENFRKRTEREKGALLAYGKKEFALKLLPMYEVLLREQKKMQTEKGQTSGKEAKSLQDGMRMILGELDKAFKSEGITKMDVLNKPYDPATQEVVATVPAPEDKDGLVIDEVKMGFMMQGQVLRPASVVVGQAQKEN